MENLTKIKSFNNLLVWQKAHQLVILIYQETKLFPKDEQFGLTNQMRRSAVSITSNIAEGFYYQSIKTKIKFYVIARASLGELKNQILISRDIKYLNSDKFNLINQKIIEVHKLLNCLISSCRKRGN
jgi:four helix bundle protein